MLFDQIQHISTKGNYIYEIKMLLFIQNNRTLLWLELSVVVMVLRYKETNILFNKMTEMAAINIICYTLRFQ